MMNHCLYYIIIPIKKKLDDDCKDDTMKVFVICSAIRHISKNFIHRMKAWSTTNSTTISSIILSQLISSIVSSQVLKVLITMMGFNNNFFIYFPHCLLLYHHMLIMFWKKNSDANEVKNEYQVVNLLMLTIIFYWSEY